MQVVDDESRASVPRGTVHEKEQAAEAKLSLKFTQCQVVYVLVCLSAALALPGTPI